MNLSKPLRRRWLTAGHHLRLCRSGCRNTSVLKYIIWGGVVSQCRSVDTQKIIGLIALHWENSIHAKVQSFCVDVCNFNHELFSVLFPGSGHRCCWKICTFLNTHPPPAALSYVHHSSLLFLGFQHSLVVRITLFNSHMPLLAWKVNKWTIRGCK